MLSFSTWHELSSKQHFKFLPKQPGIYCIRQIGKPYLLYVGQTGMPLSKRLAMLAGAYAPEMPYRDPHTAAPALWAELHRTGLGYEIAVAPLPTASTPERQGLEALVIAQHRQNFGFSPLFNFGRMPSGYRMSSANNSRLLAQGKRYRGGLTDEENESHRPGVQPSGCLESDVNGKDWLGLSWTPWFSIEDYLANRVKAAQGIYRIRRRGDHLLTYVGEGKIYSRICSHLAKGVKGGSSQAALFKNSSELQVSIVASSEWLHHHRLEIETDLIGSHMLMIGTVPKAQFLGCRDSTNIFD